MITDDKKEEVRQAADIVEVVGDYVQLKKAGQSFTGLCPFHNEKTPSFNVNPNLGIYKCFGCGEGGDVFSFLMKMEGVGFTEAIRTLADRYHVEIPDPEWTDQQREDATHTEGVLHALKFAGLYYFNQLNENGEALHARDYLKERGYSMKWLRTFGIGYSPSQGDALLKAAQKEGISEEILLDADLIKPRQQGEGFYDTFRGRLMFPIFNPSGRLIAFAGRTLQDEKKTAKYVNSAQTIVYNKSAVLYGINFAKNDIRKEQEVILVEGYTDVMSLHRVGIKHVVASSGTALTEQQIRLLKRYTNRLVMIYDSDSAGQKAMERGLDIALEGGFEVEMLQLPEGEDPDSFVRSRMAEAGLGQRTAQDAAETEVQHIFRQYRRKYGADFITFLIQKADHEGRLAQMSEQTALLHHLLDFISRIDDSIRRQIAVQQLHQQTRSFRSGTDRELHLEVEKRISERSKQSKLRSSREPIVPDFRRDMQYSNSTDHSLQKNRSEPLKKEDGIRTDQPSVDKLGQSNLTQIKKRPEYERVLLKMMIENGVSLSRYVGEQINEEYFEDLQFRKIYADIIDRVSKDKSISPEVYRSSDATTAGIIADILFEQYSLGDSAKRHLMDSMTANTDPVQITKAALKPLKLHYLKRIMADLNSQLRVLSDAQSTSQQSETDTEQRKALVMTMQVVQREISQLERRSADDLFPDPPGYREAKTEIREKFSYNRKK